MAGTSTFRKTSIWGTVGRGVFGCGWGQGSIRYRSSGPFTSIPWVAIHFASLSHVLVGLDSSEYSLASVCLVGSRGRGLGLAVRWLVAWTVGATIGLPDFVASFASLPARLPSVACHVRVPYYITGTIRVPLVPWAGWVHCLMTLCIVSRPSLRLAGGRSEDDT